MVYPLKYFDHITEANGGEFAFKQVQISDLPLHCDGIRESNGGIHYG